MRDRRVVVLWSVFVLLAAGSSALVTLRPDRQIWPVLAAMLLIGADGVARRVAGAALLVTMVVSLGVTLRPISTAPGVQFLDVADPRYFFVCRGPVECAAYGTDAPVTFGTRREKTKVRVNGVVSPAVARLEYHSAPGARPGSSRCGRPTRGRGRSRSGRRR
ncbi:hypothetical protein [Micromonospora sp. NPDC047074]|uniref:hypothetical protein n=1 Tax=Micromonospora sp. NPDC047074 TaxID=3154339 RepID=UPI003411E5B9